MINTSIFKKERLEKLLLVQWPEFLDSREMASFIQTMAVQELNHDATCVVKRISLSRFEIVDDGFLIWIETTITEKKRSINKTVELFLTNNGQIIFYDAI